MIYRDLKPENILKKGDMYKIADFGMARYSGTGKSAKTAIGTPIYMAPLVL